MNEKSKAELEKEKVELDLAIKENHEKTDQHFNGKSDDDIVSEFVGVGATPDPKSKPDGSDSK